MDEVAWEAPGVGRWDLDLAHCLGSMTPIMQDVHADSMTSGIRELFATLGMPAETIDTRFVNGYLYGRLRPLLTPDKAAKKAPPALAVKLVFKLHPKMRRRAKRAEVTLETKPWRGVIRDWSGHERADLEAENLALQDIDVTALDDAALVDHLQTVIAATRAGYHRHFVLHGYDLGPIGLLLVSARDWGIGADEIVPALQGASPSTSEPARIVARLRAAVEASGTLPHSLEEVQALSPEASAELDAYLRYRGMQVFSRYDIDGVTLAEVPDVVLATILGGRHAAGADDPDEVARRLRARVPAGERDEFDELLREARFAMDLRDDNGPTTAEWRIGLLRRAMVEAGRRLAARGRITRQDDAFELSADEVGAIFAGAPAPTAEELVARGERRRQLSALTPPAHLGPVEPEPPLAAMPAATGRLLDVVRTVLDLLGSQPRAHDLSGTGIGATSYRGVVRTARSPEEAIARLEPGDVLVVPFTTPAYNAVLPLAGALVTSEGGPLCHAAVLARELGLAAVVGAAGALAQLHDGMEVDVDPVAGEVRVVTRAATPA